MDEGKTCNDECRDEELTMTNLEDTPTNGRQEAEIGYDGPNKINDLVIKEMDLGYLVKIGCQTLCLETKETLIKLFTAYVNNPGETMDKYYKDRDNLIKND